LDADGQIVGREDSLSRLISLGCLIFKWYAVASVIFIVGVSFVGFVTFSKADHLVHWQSPWLVLVVLTGLSLWTLPFISLLEGCNQVSAVNEFRFIRAMLANPALWISLALGAGLWAAPISTFVKLATDLYLLLIRYGRFFKPFLKKHVGQAIDWGKDIWPMQWRLGLAGLTNYFIFSLFNPVMFWYHGAAVAGQMGMSLQVVSAAQQIALAWVSVKAPQFGILVAQADFKNLDRMWLRVTFISLIVVTLGATAIGLLVYQVHAMHLPIAQRLLGTGPTVLLLVAAILMHISQCQTAYILAHKRAPFVFQALVSGAATGLGVWFLGKRYGPMGASAGYLAVVAFFIIPYESYLWLRCRQERMN
jgi:O-antigen/teichoic acid export membrane protein